MADGWLNHEQYQAYGYETIEAADFPRLSARATLTILELTHWRAATRCGRCQLESLAGLRGAAPFGCSSPAADRRASSEGTVTSSSNDGYTESYASAADLRKEAATRDRETVRQALGGPATSWMLYAGGVYHPPARH